jgi:hypothetical protein
MIKKFVIALAIIFSGVALAPVSVQATSPAAQMAVCGSGAGNIFGIQPWYACLKAKNGSVSIKAINDVFYILFPLVESLVKIGAYVAIFVIFFMLIKMVTARGNAGQIATAGNGIRDAIIGLIICVSAVAVVNFVAGTFIR